MRDTLLHWTAAGVLPRERLPEALRIAGVVPSASRWQAFLMRAFTWLGMALLAAAAVCFVAANWQALGRFAKFALVEGALAATLAFALWRGLDTQGGRIALFACAALMGVLLALVGQVYQTGADTVELFLAWAVAIAVWVAVGRQPALWLLWLVLLNVAVLLYFRTSVARGLGVVELLFVPRVALWSVFALDAAALALWEIAGARFGGVAAQRLGPRVVATAAGAVVTALACVERLHFGHDPSPWVWLPFAAWIGALYWAYRVRTRDLYMLTGMMLSVIVAIAVTLGQPLLQRNGVYGFLLVGLLLLACAAAASYWLRQVGSEDEASS